MAVETVEVVVVGMVVVYVVRRVCVVAREVAVETVDVTVVGTFVV